MVHFAGRHRRASELAAAPAKGHGPVDLTQDGYPWYKLNRTALGRTSPKRPVEGRSTLHEEEMDGDRSQSWLDRLGIPGRSVLSIPCLGT
jgi:hypothetical protein